jgi:type II secretory pathway pseudopilin PulG
MQDAKAIRGVRSTRNSAARAAFTLVEALVATSITAIAGSALLLGMSSALNTTNFAVEQTIAEGMAQQLMDEIASKRYAAAVNAPYETTLGPSATEKAGAGRERFNDLDDFNGFFSMPAADPWGQKLGTDSGTGAQRPAAFQSPNYFDRWRQEIAVYYVREDDLTKQSAVPTNYRAVEVRIQRAFR